MTRSLCGKVKGVVAMEIISLVTHPGGGPAIIAGISEPSIFDPLNVKKRRFWRGPYFT